MGVDIRCELTTHTSVENLSTAIALALGAELRIFQLGSGSDAWVTRAKGQFKLEPIPNIIGCYDFTMYNVPFVSNGVFSTMIHSEVFSESGYIRFIAGAANALNIALGEKLVKCFGGKLIANDCNGIVTFIEPVQTYMSAGDGIDWNKRQQRLSEVTAISQEDLDRCEKLAAYKSKSIDKR